MADKNFQQELSALDRSAILKTTLWVMDQIESGTQNWRPDYQKLYPRFINIDPIELLVNVAGYKDTTQVFAHASEIRRRLRDELEKLEAQEEAQSTPPGQIPIGTAPPLPHNYYAVMAQLDVLLDQKKHQLALELARTIIESNVPQSLGVAVTSADIDAIVDDATLDLIATLPYTDTKKYSDAVSQSVKNAISTYSKTTGASPDLNLEQKLLSAASSFTSRQRDNLSETAAISQVATVATLIDPNSPATPIISEEIKNTIDAYQRATNSEGNEIRKSQASLEGYARGYINQFLIGVGPIITSRKNLTKKDITREGKRAHDFVFRKFEEELKATYSPEELAFFRQNFMQRALGLIRLQLGIVGDVKDIEKGIDLATPELASISLSAVAGLKGVSDPQKTLQDTIYKPPANLVPEKLQENLVAAYMQSEPLATSMRENTVLGILGITKRSLGEKARTLPLTTVKEGATQIGRELKSQSQQQLEQELAGQQQPVQTQGIFGFRPTTEQIEKAKKDAEGYLSAGKPIPFGIQSIIALGREQASIAPQAQAELEQWFTKNQGIFRFKPTIEQIQKAKLDAEGYLRLGKPVPFEIQSIIALSSGQPPEPEREGRESEAPSKPNIRLHSLRKRYFKQAELLDHINRQPLANQKSRSFAARFFRSISKPIRSTIPRPVSGRLLQIIGKAGALLGRVSAVIGGVLILLGIAGFASKIIKRLSIALGALYLWLSQINLAVLVGALVGSTIGFVAGAISGAILGFQAGLFISGLFGPAAPIAAIFIVPTTTIAGAIIGALIGAGVGGAIGASIAAILSGTFGSGATIGSIVGAIVGGLFWGPLFPIGIILGFYGGALAGWIFETYIAPVFKGTGEAISSGAATAGTGLTGAISGFFSAVWNTILGIGSGILNFFSGFFSTVLGGLTLIPGISAIFGFFGIATIVGITAIIIVTSTSQESGAKNLTISKIAPAQVANNSPVDYQLTVGDQCASEVVVTDNFTATAPLETLSPPEFIDPQVESVITEPDPTPKGYVGQVKWTIKLKPAGPNSGSCGVDPADQQFLPPDGLYNPPTPANDPSAQKPSIDLINANKPVYLQAAQKTGIPWKMLAGFHWLEGGNRADASLSNGGPIGPGRNLDEGGNYTSARSYCSNVRQEGVPYFDGTYCYWPTLLDSAIWAGLYVKEVKSQMCYGKFTDWKDAICSEGAYNGYQSRYDGIAPNGDFVKGLRNGYTTSYLQQIENWWFNSDQNPPFYKYGAYTVFVTLAQSLGPTTTTHQYWMLLDRLGKKEYLFDGPYNIRDRKYLVKEMPVVLPGLSGQTPTPLPQKVHPATPYWVFTTADPTAPVNHPYFLVLDIPGHGSGCGGDCGGPVPYLECGPSGTAQCNWVVAGRFGLHGVDSTHPITDPGSSGCVRHTDADIDFLWNTLSTEITNKPNTIRYYIEDGVTLP